MCRLDGVEHRPIERIEFLIAAPARAGVENRVGVVAVKIRVTFVDFAEVGEQRNQFAAALVDAVANFVKFPDFTPGENLSDAVRRQGTTVHYDILFAYA